MSGLSASGRRRLEKDGIELWLKSLKKRPSRRRLGRQLEENGEDQIEIHVAFHYTAAAETWAHGDLEKMKNQAFLAVAEGNLALINSGVSEMAFIMHPELIFADMSAHEGKEDSWKDWGLGLSKSELSVADINILLMAKSELEG